MLQIIDLDAPENAALIKSRGWEEAMAAFYCHYFMGNISNSNLITLSVWLGLRETIHHTKQEMYIPLALKIAECRSTENSPSFLMGACMIVDDLMNYWDIEDQKMLLQKLKHLQRIKEGE